MLLTQLIKEGVETISSLYPEREAREMVYAFLEYHIGTKRHTHVVEPEYEEYTVRDGDTLVEICKKKYDSLSKMEEICQINNIENADYIAPGQKLYLP